MHDDAPRGNDGYHASYTLVWILYLGLGQISCSAGYPSIQYLIFNNKNPLNKLTKFLNSWYYSNKLVATHTYYRLKDVQTDIYNIYGCYDPNCPIVIKILLSGRIPEELYYFVKISFNYKNINNNSFLYFSVSVIQTHMFNAMPCN